MNIAGGGDVRNPFSSCRASISREDEDVFDRLAPGTVSMLERALGSAEPIKSTRRLLFLVSMDKSRQITRDRWTISDVDRYPLFSYLAE